MPTKFGNEDLFFIHYRYYFIVKRGAHTFTCLLPSAPEQRRGEGARTKKIPISRGAGDYLYYTPSLARGASRVLFGTAADGVGLLNFLILCITSSENSHDMPLFFSEAA